jgi:predicted Abi (CAAX) family protease
MNHEMSGPLLRQRLVWAYSTLPSKEGWVISILLILIPAILLLPIGFKFGFFERLRVPPAQRAIRLTLIAFFTPALAEETFFRALLLPHSNERSTLKETCAWGLLSLVLFVGYHPIKSFMVSPVKRQLFRSGPFLVFATLLGTICSVSYYCDGSVWLPVLIHWAWVVVWLLLLGGYRKIGITM